MTRAFFVSNEIYVAFLLNSQEQGVSGKNEHSTQTPGRGAPEARGPMQQHRLHRLKAGPVQTNVLAKIVDAACVFRDSGAAVGKQFRRHGGILWA